MKPERRQGILNRLFEADGQPVAARILAAEFGVSRQIIVKDIAALRTAGVKITSHARGYTVEKAKKAEKVFKVIHTDGETEKELELVVDSGGEVLDVFVYHKFYNKVTAKLNIKTKDDIKKFLEDIAAGKSSLLKNVTSGYHYHTVSAENEAKLELIEEKLKDIGFLAPFQDYEPAEINKDKI